MNRAKIFIAFTFLLAFAVCVSAQSVQFSNELKGYEFFGNGKIKGLQLMVSSKEDVKNIFGEDCEKQCDYDEDWLMRLRYFEEGRIEPDSDSTDEKPVYFLDSKYFGKLRSVEIRPKKQMSFSDIYFPEIFHRGIIDTFSELPSGRGGHSTKNTFTDSDGLM